MEELIVVYIIMNEKWVSVICTITDFLLRHNWYFFIQILFRNYALIGNE